jgi:cytochrome c-type biogenesis protein CcmH/NrfF
MWIFWVGPIVGAVLAVALYKFMNKLAHAEEAAGKAEEQETAAAAEDGQTASA